MASVDPGACDGVCYDVPVPPLTGVDLGTHGTYRKWNPSEIQDAAARLYTRLRPWQTRIVRIHPGLLGSVLVADLLHANIVALDGLVLDSNSEHVQYEALSYSWGNPEFTGELRLNGVSYPITSQMQMVLRRFRMVDRPRYLWVDCICINQVDSIEKSAQVLKMLEIFQKATCVLVWLGKREDDGHLAMACLETYYTRVARLHMLARVEHSGGCLGSMARQYSAVQKLYHRPWLRRTWVRQEVYAANDLIVCCGAVSVSWSAFLRGVEILSAMKPGIDKRAQETHEVKLYPGYERVILDMSASTQGDPLTVDKAPRDLFDVLLASRHYLVTDRKDLVYAVLGMCHVPTTIDSKATTTEGRRRKLVIDYRKIVSQVYRDMAVFWFDKPDGLAYAFNFLARKVDTRQEITASSWAMDWKLCCCSEEDASLLRKDMISRSTAISGTYDTSRRNLDRFLPLRSTTNFADWIRPHYSGENDDRVLKVSGRLLNWVAELLDFTCELGYFVQDGRSVCSWVENVKENEGFIETLKKFLGKQLMAFDPHKHHRRLAVLGSPAETRLALIPATARKGDILVAIAEEVFPLVFSPLTTEYENKARLHMLQATLGNDSLRIRLRGVDGESMTIGPTKRLLHATRAQITELLDEIAGDWTYECHGPALTEHLGLAFSTISTRASSNSWSPSFFPIHSEDQATPMRWFSLE